MDKIFIIKRTLCDNYFGNENDSSEMDAAGYDALRLCDPTTKGKKPKK